jgi:hypothetical protein
MNRSHLTQVVMVICAVAGFLKIAALLAAALWLVTVVQQNEGTGAVLQSCEFLVGQSSCGVAEVQHDVPGCRAQGQVHSSGLLLKATCGEHFLGFGVGLAPHEDHEHPAITCSSGQSADEPSSGAFAGGLSVLLLERRLPQLCSPPAGSQEQEPQLPSFGLNPGTDWRTSGRKRGEKVAALVVR